MSRECADCDVRWAPYQTNHGTCWLCGHGTKRVHEPVSENAGALFEIVKVQRGREHRLERFEAYYAARVESENQTLVAEPEPH